MHTPQRSRAFGTVRALLRRLRLATPVVVAALVLAGCMQLKLDVHVNPDNTVSGAARIGVQKSLLEAVGGVDAFYKELESGGCSDIGSDKHVQQQRYDDGKFIGIVCTYQNQPLSQFNKQDSSDPSGNLSIVRDGDTFKLDGRLDLKQALSDSGSGSSDISLSPAQILKNADIELAFTFPGKITQSTGTVDGHRVSFKPDSSGALNVHAVAGATPSSANSSGLPTGAWIAIAAAVVLLIAGLVFFLLRRNRQQPAYAGTGGYGGPEGFAEYPGGQPGQNGQYAPPSQYGQYAPPSQIGQPSQYGQYGQYGEQDWAPPQQPQQPGPPPPPEDQPPTRPWPPPQQ